MSRIAKNAIFFLSPKKNIWGLIAFNSQKLSATVSFSHEEIKLLDGLLYEIDFDQGFASKRLKGQPI
jgi:hypothetical protein